MYEPIVIEYYDIFDKEKMKLVLKKAFLFSCLTGLRKSDIKQLTWGV